MKSDYEDRHLFLSPLNDLQKDELIISVDVNHRRHEQHKRDLTFLSEVQDEFVLLWSEQMDVFGRKLFGQNARQQEDTNPQPHHHLNERQKEKSVRIQ